MVHTIDGYLGDRGLPGLLTVDVNFDGQRHIRCPFHNVHVGII